MITKPERIIKRIIKAVGQRQSVLVIGDWQEELIKGLKENQNAIIQESGLEDNSITRIVADYGDVIARRAKPDEAIPIYDREFDRDCHASLRSARNDNFFKEARRLLLPTSIVIISANCELNIFEKIINKLNPQSSMLNTGLKRIKPKQLQDQIHDNGFLIDGYYGYPGGHLLMMAQIQNKDVTTLFTSEKQETIVK